MNLIVRNDKPAPTPEPYEKRVARIIAENAMESLSNEELSVIEDDRLSPLREGAAYLLRTRTHHEFDSKLWTW